MVKTYIIRHGQDTDNATGILNGWRDTSLTELGRNGAYKTAEKLEDKNIQVIYSSPLKRAKETARIIADELGIAEVQIASDLIERNFGVMTGKLVADIKKYTDKILESDGINYFIDVEGAEPYPDLLKRGGKVLNEIRQNHPNENILLVTHGDIGKMIRAAHYGWIWEQGLKTPYFANAEAIELK
ncbi:MAG: histidine phosphatase family protein [bacterium]